MSGSSDMLRVDAEDDVFAEGDICVEGTPSGGGIHTEQMAVGDELRIPVFAEELTATARPVEASGIQIKKRIISEGRVLEVPVTEDEIRVERRIVDRRVHGVGIQAFEQIIIEIPLRKEIVDAENLAHATEEIVVTKDVIQRTERVTDTVRREEVSIDGGDRVMGDG
jgi:uncharacterized protein (TIGR02271 family)